MTDNDGVEKTELNIEENNNNCTDIIQSAAVGSETLECSKESSGVFCENVNETVGSTESDSDVINAFIQSTSDEVGYVFYVIV